MKKNLIRFIPIIMMVMLFAGCFEITDLDQPSKAKSGKVVKTVMEVKTSGTDANPHYGIVGFKIPVDWEVKSVKMKGDYGRDTFELLPPGTPDGDPGGQVDYWTRSLERIFETDDDMHWVVYQSEDAYEATEEVAFADIYMEFKVGKPGNYEIDYFVTNGALDFSEPSWYGLSQENSIEITN